MEKIRVACECGAELSAPMSAAGRQARCPRCKRMNTVPGGTMAQTSAAAKQPAAMPQQAPRMARARAPVAPDSDVDFSAGFLAPPDRDAAIPPDVANPMQVWRQDLGRGTTWAIAACVLACVAWCFLAMMTGGGMGFFTLLVGPAAGIGMMLAIRRSRAMNGLICAALTVVAILVTQFGIFQSVLLPQLKKTDPGEPLVSAADKVLRRIPEEAALEAERRGAQSDVEQSNYPSATEAQREAARNRMEEATRKIEAYRARNAEAWMQRHLSFSVRLFDVTNLTMVAISVLAATLIPLLGRMRAE